MLTTGGNFCIDFNTEEKNEIEKKNFVNGSKAAAYFESTSKDCDKVMKVLGRNRKYLLDVFNKISKSSVKNILL